MKLNFCKIVVVLLLSLCGVELLAQAKTLELVGFAKDKGKPVAGVHITVFDGSTLVTEYTTTGNGRYELYLDYNKDFKVVIEKDGYVKEIMTVNTILPKDFPLEDNSKDVYLKMYAFPKDGSELKFEEPVAKVFFQEDIQDFNYDLSYAKSIKAKLDDLEKKIDDKNIVVDAGKKNLGDQASKAAFDQQKAEQEALKAEAIKSAEGARLKEIEAKKKEAELKLKADADRLAVVSSKQLEDAANKAAAEEKAKRDAELLKIEADKEKVRLAAADAKKKADEEERKRNEEELKMHAAKQSADAERQLLEERKKQEEEERLKAEKAAEAAKIAVEEAKAKAIADEIKRKEDEAAKIKAEEDRMKSEKAAALAKKADEDKKAKEAEEQRLAAKAAEEARLAEEARKVAEAEKAKADEQQRLEELARKAEEAERLKKLEAEAKLKSEANEMLRLEEVRKAREAREKIELDLKKAEEEKLRVEAESLRLKALEEAKVKAEQDSVRNALLTISKRQVEEEKAKAELAKQKEEAAMKLAEEARIKATEEKVKADAAKAAADAAESKRKEEEERLAVQEEVARKIAAAANAKAAEEKRLSELKALRQKAIADSMSAITVQEGLAQKAAEIERKRKEEAIARYKEKLQQDQTTIVKSTDTKEVDFTNKEQKEQYLSELAQKYPEGITRESVTEAKRIINKVIVVKAGKADEYKEVKYSYGGVYYFKNGTSITATAYNSETK